MRRTAPTPSRTPAIGAAVAVVVMVAAVAAVLGLAGPDGPSGRTREAAATTPLARVAAAAPRAAPRRATAAELDADLRAARRPDPAVPRARTHGFDAVRALGLARLQVAAGPRPAGSAALARVRAQLVARLPRARRERVAGHPGLVNVVGRIPGRRPAVVLAAHYDTQLRPAGFVGANDSAAGTAVVLEAARALARRTTPAGAREVRFVLFDGEELPPDGQERSFAADGLRGSRAYAAAHPGEVGSLVLADYVANRGLRLPKEAGSDPVLWARLRAAAARAGVGPVLAGTGIGIIDDHLPFLQQGVPAVDLIDWDYPQKNTAADTLDRLSERAMDATGETVVQWLLADRRR